MALGNLVVKIVGDNSELDRSIDSSKSKLDSFAQSASQIGKKLTTFVTLPILGIGAAALKSAADMEVQEAAFTTLLGSADAARAMLQQLTDFSAKTPFQLKDLAQATKTMLSFGIAQQDIMPNLQALGDIAQGDSEKLKSLTLAFSQIQSTGKLMGQDLLQLINAGFNPLQVISQKTGETMSELKDRMSQGAISAAEITDAFKTATSEGGMFFGGMETASKTLTGQISTLKDNVGILGRSLVESLLPTIKDMVSGATELVQKFANLDDGQKKLILTLAGIAAAAGPVIAAIGGISTAISFLAANPIVLAIAAVAGLALGVNALISAKAKKDLQEYTNQIHDMAIAAGVAEESVADLAKELNKIAKFSDTKALLFKEDIPGMVAEIAVQYGITNVEAANLLRQNEKLSDVIKLELDNYQSQFEWLDKINADAKTRTSEFDEQVQLSDDLLQKLKEQRAASEAQAAEEQRIKDELAEQLRLIREQALERKKDAYQTFLDANAQAQAKLNLGLIDEIQYKGLLLQAEEAYVQALLDEGVYSKAVYNGHIDKLLQMRAEYEALTAKVEEVTETTVDLADTTGIMVDKTKQYYAEVAAAADAYAKRQQQIIDNYKETAGVLTGYLSPVLTQIGNQLVAESFNWQQVGFAALNTLAQIVKALAEQAAVQAAIELAKGNIAGAALWGTASGLGFIAAGAISGYNAKLQADAAAAAQAAAEASSAADTAAASSNATAEATAPRTTTTGTGREEMISLRIDLDSKPLLEKIFPATKNGTVLISARAVV